MFSIPDVALIEIYAMPAKQFTVFLLKCASAMVLLLRFHVLQRGVKLTRAHRKCAISTLPEEAAVARMKRFDPSGRCFLCLLDELSNGNSSRQSCDNVNMVGNTADVHEIAA